MLTSRVARTGLVALGLMLAASPNPLRPGLPVAAAQVTDSLPAILLGQIAEAASRFRTGRVAWVIYCLTPPRVVTIVDAISRARTLAETAGPACGMMAVRTPPPDTTPPVSATLARLLAEAADGYRTGRPTWFVARDSFPHGPLLGPFESYDAARDSAQLCVTSGCRVHGPFIALMDEGLAPVLSGCFHMPKSPYICDTLPTMEFAALDSVTLTLFSSAGPPVSLRWGQWGVDAIFLTRSAVDKFALPYYTRLYGAEYAAEMLRLPRR